MTTFKQHLATLPSIDHLSGLDVVNLLGLTVHHIPNAPNTQGSLKIYHALSLGGKELDEDAVAMGLILFAEHVEAAQKHPGSHPNIDFLLAQKNHNLEYRLKPITAATPEK